MNVLLDMILRISPNLGRDQAGLALLALQTAHWYSKLDFVKTSGSDCCC